MRRFILLSASTVLAAFVACSDDDGSNILPNPPPGSDGGGAGGSPDAGPVAGSGGSAAGTGGSSAGAGGNGGGAGGSAGCTPVAVPDGGLDAGALDAGSTDGGLEASAEPSGIVSFAGDVHPIFAESCGPCHVTDNSAGHNVGGPDVASAYAEAVDLGQRLVIRVDGGGMPPSYADPPNDCGAEGRGDQPGDPGCLTVAEVQLIQTWIDQCYPM